MTQARPWRRRSTGISGRQPEDAGFPAPLEQVITHPFSGRG